MSAYEQGIAAIKAAFERALASGRRNMNAMSLATVDENGAPSVRTVLMKGVDEQGLTFFTDERSKKGRDLASQAIASVCFYWEPIEEQARIDGTIERLEDSLVAADFKGRPRAGQILIWASAQSQPLESAEALKEAVARCEAAYPDDVPVPPFWAGYRLRPTYIETWKGSRDRMHERIAYAQGAEDWEQRRLMP